MLIEAGINFEMNMEQLQAENKELKLKLESVGWRFHPTDSEIIKILKSKLTGVAHNGVKDGNVFGKNEPWELFAINGSWGECPLYFFSSRPRLSKKRFSRTVGSSKGVWKQQNTVTVSASVGLKKSLRYENTANPVESNNWLMKEYLVSEDAEFAIYKIKRKEGGLPLPLSALKPEDHKTRMPIIEIFDDIEPIVRGPITSGSFSEGEILVLMPGKVEVKVVSIVRMDSGPRGILTVRLAGIEANNILPRSVLSSVANPITAASQFLCRLHNMDDETMRVGFKAILQVNVGGFPAEECQVSELLYGVDLNTMKAIPGKIESLKKHESAVCCIKVTRPICVERASESQWLGRFFLCRGNKQVARGLVVDV